MRIHPIPKPPPDAEPEWPAEGLCYVAGQNGLFKRVRNEFYSALVKVEQIPALAELQEDARLHVPPLPLELFRRIESFFVAVYEQHQSEAVVLLCCNPATRSWQVLVPPQAVRGLHVEYDLKNLPEVPEGHQLFGTVHSHAGIKAFHSGTDDADEAHFDGLHITIGHLDRPTRSYACRWMLAGKPYPAELSEVLESTPLPQAEPDWLAQVHKLAEPERPARQERSGLGDREPHPYDDPILYEPGYAEFESREEYLLYLEDLRERIEEQLEEAQFLEPQGEAHVGTQR